MTTIENIKSLLKEIRENKSMLDGHTASLKLVELSTWHANLSEEIANLQNKYTYDLDRILEENPKMSVARAKIKSEASEVFYQLNLSSRIEKSVIEEIRNLRRYIRIRENENEAGYNL